MHDKGPGELRFCPHCNGQLDDPQIIRWGGWAFDEDQNRFIEPVEVHFTRTEGLLVSAILRKKGKVARKMDNLYTALCSNRPDCDWPELKIIDVIICKIKKKLSVKNVRLIDCQWGEGYFAVPYDPDHIVVKREPTERQKASAANRVEREAFCTCGHKAKNHHIIGNKRYGCRNCRCERFDLKT